ncbi:NAD-dependent epimerase/dehydratase family protein [Streptomyces tsukubensis]|uniref:dTDP-glucose 4,6-dehydratase n=1 Tax=Streptomyces tsukubensis TaxID=83656 RepID=A0A1V4A6G8_9ACTN|nr:NAD(P)-dependent oxidoreductase [Streptomyces tsukubensis]OON77348.1 dTDP-glucose 4,6-dehydratase [Streptomyces tsukubensis]QFR92429.1 NAD(P)H-binding protein [Streptomyces tsukubensis]
MRIFLAGATGVIGRRLVPLLLAQGHEVTGLARSEAAGERLRTQGAEVAVADVLDPDALAEAVGSAAPDTVVHQLTALGSGDLTANAALRIDGTRNLVDAARAAGVRRVVAQSIAWAYTPGMEPAIESKPLDLGAEEPRLTTVMGAATLERTVQEMPEWVVLRYGMLYGPETWYSPGGLMADKARAGELVADTDVTSFAHIEDAAVAALAALEWPSGVVNICDNEPATGLDWLPVFCEAVGAPAPRADATTERQGWARGADNTYAREELGWTPLHPTWRDGFGTA